MCCCSFSFSKARMRAFFSSPIRFSSIAAAGTFSAFAIANDRSNSIRSSSDFSFSRRCSSVSFALASVRCSFSFLSAKMRAFSSSRIRFSSTAATFSASTIADDDSISIRSSSDLPFSRRCRSMSSSSCLSASCSGSIRSFLHVSSSNRTSSSCSSFDLALRSASSAASSAFALTAASSNSFSSSRTSASTLAAASTSIFFFFCSAFKLTPASSTFFSISCSFTLALSASSSAFFFSCSSFSLIAFATFSASSSAMIRS
mmetsp:Transcript_4881/g.5558  ORF Transcript_4881/g.5558 Transcript_4881/m.5558 type:complete len:259 (-) Transcript_4881:287-1063(-)